MFRGMIRVILITLFSVLFVAGAFGGGFVASRIMFPPPLPPDGGAPSDWKASLPVFWEAWNYVHQDFYKPPLDQDTLVEGSIGGMVQALGDPNTVFVDAKRAVFNRPDLQGSFEGIGATVSMREGRLAVVSIIKGSPAERAGLRAEDIILQVNDTVIQNMDTTQAVTLIRGPKGTKVKLLVQRAKQDPFTLEITRDTIRTPFVESKMIEGTTIAYVHLTGFGATATEEMQIALKELKAQRPTGLIFDLRRNLGGYLTAGLDISSDFLKAGQTLLIIKDKSGKQLPCTDARGLPNDCKTKSDGIATDIPMVLLVDEFSASASEIVAGALKDYGRATLIGVRTLGKGSAQNVHTLSDQSELHVTVVHFFSPKGHDIHEVGVAPDIEVKMTADDLANGRDPQLDAALKFLQKGK